MVLVVLGTLAQVNIGTFAAQKEYFNSFLIYKSFGSVKIPMFPGGLSVGALWLANLASVFIVRFRWNRTAPGILIIHSGILVLLLGQLLTQMLSIESQMPIEIGQSSNFSESPRDMELAIVANDSGFDDVTAVPEKVLRRESLILPPGKPFALRIKKYFRNAQIQTSDGPSNSLADQGIGSRVHVHEQPPVSSDDELNNVSVFAEILEGDKSLGTWLVALGLGAPQSFFAGGREYRLSIRAVRHYHPFTVTLKEFHHDIYPGTDIPKNFSSLVHLSDPEKNESRDALIYMNNPLRYGGLTFYQSSFGKNDTLSVFQVVRNPAWLTPYISCILVMLGLSIQFVASLLKFAKRPA